MLLSDNLGKKFYIGFLSNHEQKNVLDISIASQASGQIQIEVPFLGISENRSISRGLTTVHVNETIEKRASFIDKRGIYLQSNVDVAVFVSSFRDSTQDTYNALPVDMLGTIYTIASNGKTNGNYYSEFMVIATENRTSVFVNFINGTRINKTLDRIDVYQELNRADMTGSVVITDKPVAVISGHSCTVFYTGSCDLIMTQLLPAKYLGQNYIVPFAGHMRENRLLVIETVNNTEIQISFINGTTSKNTSTGVSTEIDIKNMFSPATVVSSQPVMVLGYIGPDPCMSILPSVEQYRHNYIFIIPEVYNIYSNFLAVVIPKSQISGVMLDGHSLTNFSSYDVPQPYENYSVNIFSVSIGYHLLKHIDGTKLMALAFNDYSLSKYCYAVGYGTAESYWGKIVLAVFLCANRNNFIILTLLCIEQGQIYVVVFVRSVSCSIRPLLFLYFGLRKHFSSPVQCTW